MAFPTFAAFESELEQQRALRMTVIASSLTSLRANDLSRLQIKPDTGSVAAAPTTSAALTSSSAVALNAEVGGVGDLRAYLIGARMSASNSSGSLILIDRLVESGGLNGTITTTQTTNLPTATLPRFTDGAGVMIGLSIYTSVGSTGTTVTASYTNQAGVSGRTTQAMAFGGTNFSTVNRIIVLPLADGDTGVQSVESVTLAGTTGTAGNFGVTLFRPLGAISLDMSSFSNNVDLIGSGLACGLPDISDACLGAIWITSSSASNLVGALHFALG